MFLSYAQRLEDYHLALAFAGEPPGVYIDVGGGHPVADNVTFALYLSGWSGLVVEPQETLAALYPRLRPRDRIAATLVGRAEGIAAFHRFETFHGLSTADPERARAAAVYGGSFAIEERPVTTLAALCAAEGIGRVDILKIDVEGAEGEVIAGADFARWRPRLVLAEVVAPGAEAGGVPDFEAGLLARGYRFALFDGLNRFYVAQEETALAAQLPSTPAPWDAVRHLYACGRAPENEDHPDHPLARRLVEAFLARLPALDDGTLRDLLGAAEPGLGTDAFRAALGRIAAPYDGGLPAEEPAAGADT